jgi:hypothetical protein
MQRIKANFEMIVADSCFPLNCFVLDLSWLSWKSVSDSREHKDVNTLQSADVYFIIGNENAIKTYAGRVEIARVPHYIR